MNVLLVNPPHDLESLMGAGKAFVQKFEPLGLLYIAALAREHGYNVSVIDAYAEELSLDDIKKRIHSINPDVIGISSLTCTGEIVYALGRWIKQDLPHVLVVLGNIHASVYSEQYLKHRCCDLVVHGEGEEVFLKILLWRQKKLKREEIPSISFLNECHDQVTTSKGKAVVGELNSLPFPARRLVKQRLYNITEISNLVYLGKKGTISKTMSTSRGCPNRCSFCVVHGSEPQRFMAVNKVVDEMELLEKEFNASYILFTDPSFFSNRQRVIAICGQIRKQRLRISWGADADVRYITKEIIEAIASAGCYELSFGIESGVQRLLNNVQKDISIEQVKNVINLVKKHSTIKIGGLFILGLPGETYRDSLQTIRFAKTLPLDIAQFSILTPYPGSFLFEQLWLRGEIDSGVREDGSLDTSVWKRYSSYISFIENDPIWVTPTLSTFQLKQLQKRAQREFYLRPSQIVKHIKRIRPSNISQIVKILSRGFF